MYPDRHSMFPTTHTNKPVFFICIQAYVTAKIQQFAVAFASKINPHIVEEAVMQLMGETIAGISAQAQMAIQPSAMEFVMSHRCE